MKPLAASVFSRHLPLLLVPLAALFTTTVTKADAPANVGRGLRPLLEWHHAQPTTRTVTERRDALIAHRDVNLPDIQVDGSGAVIVEIRLDGSVTAAAVKQSLASLGVTVTREYPAQRADGRDGMLAAHLPLEQAEVAARVPGVFSILAAHRPHAHVGRTTSQGVGALHADAVQTAGYSGTGITVGVISDSYNVATASSVGSSPRTTAGQDIVNGDLPSQGVVVLEDGSIDPQDRSTDEGRGMLQIIHDVAPGAKLAFHAVGNTQVDFAAAIRALRTNAAARCDIIVDDIGFNDEPFFSDGIVAQAVDDVVTSSVLSGTKVIYYSAAGNEGDVSYSATFSAISDAAARGRQVESNNLKLGQVPPALTAGGFHNFETAAGGTGASILQKIKVSRGFAELDFQWDDPFLPAGITTDYNVLVFDAAGNYLRSLSGVDDNFSTGEAIEFAFLPPASTGGNRTYQIAITRTAGSGSASHIRFIAEGEAVLQGKLLQTGAPVLFGHAGAANADGVAAYDVAKLAAPEDFSSFGPVTIYFDALGNRLTVPVTRQKPTIAAVDGVNTSFFPEGPLAQEDSDNDGFPNFFGTSAAAPHAAAVAALLLDAAGGKGKLTSAQMRTLLQSTATVHDLDPAQSRADGTSADNQFQLALTAQGDGSNDSSFSPHFFGLSFTGPAGSTLSELDIDLGPAGLLFDQSPGKGFPFTISQIQGLLKSDIKAKVSKDADGHKKALLALRFKADAFAPGDTLSFGIDRDLATKHSEGNSADSLATATVTAHFTLADSSGLDVTGTFVNQTGHGYSPDVGFGLINAEAALNSLIP